jgi:hypothetical protein
MLLCCRKAQRHPPMRCFGVASSTVATAVLAAACLALLQRANAVSPAPDGGYPGGNTAEGQNSLLSLTTGAYNAAIGYGSLQSNAAGSFNTAAGAARS